MERVTGIEPVMPAWKAGALPLCNTRLRSSLRSSYGGQARQSPKDSYALSLAPGYGAAGPP